MPVITLPDGIPTSFPDDMPNEEIRALIEHKFPEATARHKYDTALKKIRDTQFPGMSDEQWAEYAKKAFPPLDVKGLAQHGQLFGLTDEIDSFIGALGSQVKDWVTPGDQVGYGEAFKDFQDLNQSRRDVGRQQLGGVGTAAEVVGGLSSFTPAVAAAPAVAPSLLSTSLKSAGTGSVMGGAYGFGAADEDRLMGAGTGALVGGVLGVAVPAVASAGGAAWQAGANALKFNGASKAAGISPAAAKFLTETMAADDALSAAGQQRIATAGPEGMLADAGKSAQNALDYAIQSSGKAGSIATKAIGDRVARDAHSIQDALDVALGQPQGVQTARGVVRQATAVPRDATYTQAYASPINYATPGGMQLETLLTRVPKAAIDRANALMMIRGEKSSQIMASIADDGSITFKTMPDVRQLDYITRALNEEASAGIGAGSMGGQTAIGSSLEELSGSIRNVLRTEVPAYDKALTVAADAIEQSQAIQRGAELLRSNTTRETVEQWVTGLSKEARKGMLQGIRSSLDDALANTRRAVQDGDMTAREAIAALRALSSRASREKVTMAIGDQKVADDLFKEIDRATKSFELRASVADNSKTFQRQAMGRRVEATVDPDGVVGALGRGEPVNAGKRVVQALTGMTPQRALQKTDALMGEVVNALTARGLNAKNLHNALGRLNAGASLTAKQSAVLRNVLQMAGATGAHLTTRQVANSGR